MSERKLFAHEIEVRLDELLLLKLRQRSVTATAEALEALPRGLQDRALHWVAVAAQSSTDLGLLLARLSAENIEWLDPWAQAGLEAFDAGGLDAAGSTLREFAVERKNRRWQDGVCFADNEQRLAKFLHALSGRPVLLAAGREAWTDSQTLWLPERLDRLPDVDSNRRLYTLMAALLWAQTRFGSFNHDPEAEIGCWPDRERALAWLAVFEAMRLEACIARELPGLAAEMAAMRGPWPVALSSAAAQLAQPLANVGASLRCLAELRKVGADGTATDIPGVPYLGRFDPLAARRIRAARIDRELATLRRALNILRGVGGGGSDPAESAPLTGAGDGAGVTELVALPADAQAALESLVQDLGEVPPEAMQPAGPAQWQPLEMPANDSMLTSSAVPDARYDEWDYRRAAYRRDWCHLYESEGPAGDPAWVDAVRQRHAPQIRSIRRRFEALRGEDSLQRRQLDGEEIDLDALVEARADRRSGADPSPRVFTQRQRDQRSLAVMFMVDMSGSTKGWVNDAERESLILLCEAIDALGDRYAIYGFSGWTRSRCDIYRIKTFASRYDGAVRARIAGIEARDYTRMGVAVRHLSQLLAAEQTRHKLLVTLSDGRPDDFGDEYRGHYGIEDTRRALLEARQQGIRSYCVTIDRHGADYLPQLYGPAHYTVVDDARKLPQRIGEIYRKLTA